MQPNAPAPLPVVRHLIACENIQPGSSSEQFTLVNVITRIRSLEAVPFPLLYRELCILAMCTECRGSGQVQIQIIEDESEEPCRTSPLWPVTFTNDPLQIVGFPFRIGPIRFPQAGLYKVRLLYNGVVLAEEPIRVSE
jgi:hypothetical protein